MTTRVELLNAVRSALKQTLWLFLVRLPLTILVAMSLFLGLALLLWLLWPQPAETSVVAKGAWAVTLFGCYLIAGLLVGIHMSLYKAVHGSLDHTEMLVKDAADMTLEAVFARKLSSSKSVPITELRSAVNERIAAAETEKDPSRGVLSRLARGVTRFVLRRQWKLMLDFLTQMQSQGVDQLSLVSVQQYLVKESTSSVTAAARRRVAWITFLVAAVVFTLLLTPLILTRMSA